MWTDGIVNLFPGAGLAIERGDGPVGKRADFIELLGVRPLGAFHRTVELG